MKNEKYTNRKNNHQCISCGTIDERTKSGKVLCQHCSEVNLQRQKKIRNTYSNEHRCIRCGELSDIKSNDKYYTLCKKCRLKMSDYMAERYRKAKSKSSL